MSADEISILKQIAFIGVPVVFFLVSYVMAMGALDSNWLLAGLCVMCIGLAGFGATWVPSP